MSTTPANASLTDRVLDIWRDVLHVPDLDGETNFFGAGGDSLIATRICTRLSEEFGVTVGVRDLFAAPTAAELAGTLEVAPARAAGPELGAWTAERTGDVPLSAGQRQMWFLEQLTGADSAYHVHRTIDVDGPFDPELLRPAAAAVVERHAGLRTTFAERDGQVRQVVHATGTADVRLVDLTGTDPAGRDDERERVVTAETRRPFGLGELPLIRWTAIRTAPEEHRLVLVLHHIVVDGWSLSSIIGETAAAYTALAGGGTPEWDAPAAQYPDFATWQQDRLARGELDAQAAYWRERLAGASGVLSLPSDRPRPAVQTYAGERLRVTLGPDEVAAVRAFGNAEGATLFAVAHAAFAALLHRWTGDDDLLVGTAFANRGHERLASMVGMLMNTVALRSRLGAGDTFRDVLTRCRRDLTDADAHQEYPFPMVVESLAGDRDPSRNPLVQVMFSAHDYVEHAPRFGAATGRVAERANGTAKTDLNVIVLPRAKSQLGSGAAVEDELVMYWEYNSDLFDESEIARLAASYRCLLAAAVAAPDRPVARLPLLSGPDRAAVLADQPALARALPAGSPLVARAALARAAERPDAVAVVAGDVSLTYRELDRRSAVLAADLARSGAGPDAVVGVCLPRCPELVIAELAAFRTGAAILPMDPAHPDDRLTGMLDNARAVALVTDDDRTVGSAPRFTVPTGSDPDGDPDGEPPETAAYPEPGPDDLAYVVYTSGSTGTPKGAMIGQHQFANLLDWHRTRFGVNTHARTTFVASPGFDFSLWEIWPTLTAGGQVHIPSSSVLLAAEDLQRWMIDSGITVSLLPTALGSPLLGFGWPASAPLRSLVVGGEQLTARPAEGLPFEVVNAYGPTETSAIATVGVVPPDGAGPPPIGRAIHGTALYVLDDELEPVPPGVAGELHIGGVGVGKGYIGRPDLTAEKFVPDPFSDVPAARLYRTGDIVRLRADGAIDYVGRADDQVKLRGFRIEPGEIAATLLGHPAVRAAHVRVRTAANGERRLDAYWVPAGPDGAAPDAAALRAFTARTLPAYMVPDTFTELAELPLNHNGKVDRRALPEPAATGSAAAVAPPAGRTERDVAAIWCAVLGVASIGRDENFFDAGGHSLLLADVRTRLRDGSGYDVPVLRLFEFTTVRSLAGYLDRLGSPLATVLATPDQVNRRSSARGDVARLRDRRRAARS